MAKQVGRYCKPPNGTKAGVICASAKFRRSSMNIDCCPFPNVIRHVTMNTGEGKASFAFSEELLHHTKLAATAGQGQPAKYSNAWVTDSPFPFLNDTRDLSKSDEGTHLLVSQGSNFRIADIPPGHMSQLHRTLSLDFAVVHRGTVHLHLDDGVSREIKEGEVVVQRGTTHSWENRTSEWVRMYFVLTAADPFRCNDGSILPKKGLR
ncbi:hypothetical protein T439DRAFT_325018 [Meredithblackwellia eburnea MCA 4105]